MDKARVIRTDTRDYKRIIAISDIHADTDKLTRLMGKLKFSDDDLLVFMGDYIERGPDSLRTLRYVMELDRHDNVICLAGNCDNILEDVFELRYRKDIGIYIEHMGRSILHEILREHAPEPDKFDLDTVRYLVDTFYSDERKWLASLGHIADAVSSVFVHSGLKTEDIRNEDAEICLKYDGFIDDERIFPFTVIAGHIPCQYINGTSGPVYDKEHNRIFIDGGCSTVENGVLNALIMQNGDTYALRAE